MKILQIMPADNWFAEFKEEKITRVPLAFWGLVQEENGDTHVEGFIFGNENYHIVATESEGFERFVRLFHE
ncbi:MAG: hypothetical protein WDM76_11950 [Limisphaerales bacterium]